MHGQNHCGVPSQGQGLLEGERSCVSMRGFGTFLTTSGITTYSAGLFSRVFPCTCHEVQRFCGSLCTLQSLSCFLLLCNLRDTNLTDVAALLA